MPIELRVKDSVLPRRWVVNAGADATCGEELDA